MKVKCICDQEYTGWLKKKIEKIEGITKGKVYDVQVVPTADCTGGTHIDIDDMCFFIWTDNKCWGAYEIDFFEPAGE